MRITDTNRLALAAALTLAISGSWAVAPAGANGPVTASDPVAETAVPAAPGADGMMLAQACAGCHGQSGEGQGAIVDIAGYDRAAFIQTWAEFRANARPATIMGRIARGYTEAEVEALADYFSSLD